MDGRMAICDRYVAAQPHVCRWGLSRPRVPYAGSRDAAAVFLGDPGSFNPQRTPHMGWHEFGADDKNSHGTRWMIPSCCYYYALSAVDWSGTPLVDPHGIEHFPIHIVGSLAMCVLRENPHDNPSMWVDLARRAEMGRLLNAGCWDDDSGLSTDQIPPAVLSHDRAVTPYLDSAVAALADSVDTIWPWAVELTVSQLGHHSARSMEPLDVMGIAIAALDRGYRP